MKYIVREYVEGESLKDSIIINSEEWFTIKNYLGYAGKIKNKELVDKIASLLLREHTEDARRWEDDGGSSIS